MGIRETSNSEPLMRHREDRGEVETELLYRVQDKVWGRPAYCPSGLRCKGGVNLIQAFAGTWEPVASMAREKLKWRTQNFWSVIIYDNQARSTVQADQQFPSISSQQKDLVVNADGSVDIYFGPKAPAHKENWIQTVPGKRSSLSERASANEAELHQKAIT